MGSAIQPGSVTEHDSCFWYEAYRIISQVHPDGGLICMLVLCAGRVIPYAGLMLLLASCCCWGMLRLCLQTSAASSRGG